jgi:inner membrane protein
MFIIDPLYTVPLLVMTVWALFGNQTSTLYRKWLVTSLVVSSLYLGWSLFAQHRIEERGREILASAGLPHSQLIATPTPFNTLFWRVIAIDGPRYYNIYLAAFGGDGAGDEGTPAIQNIPVYQQVRLSPGVKCWFDHEQQGKAPVRRLAQFSQGYFSLTQRGDDLVYADLRMGMTPYYVFSYRVASGLAESLAAVPPQRLSGPRSAPGDWAWLRAGIAGQVNARPFETAQLVPATGGSVGQVALRATEPSGGRC